MMPVPLVAGVAWLHDEHGTDVQQVIKRSPNHPAMLRCSAAGTLHACHLLAGPCVAAPDSLPLPCTTGT